MVVASWGASFSALMRFSWREGEEREGEKEKAMEERDKGVP